MRFAGRTALVTGAGSGIGARVVARLVAEGARVCLLDRHAEACRQVAAPLGPDVTTVVAGDVTDPEVGVRAVAAAVELGGGLDVVVNAAGTSSPDALLDTTLETWERVFAVNVTGPFLVMQAALPTMLARGRGAIVNVASLAAHRAFPSEPAYCASKAALVALSRQVAADYGPRGVRVTSVSPGPTNTPMLHAGLGKVAAELGVERDELARRVTAELPLRRCGEGDEVANTCAFLASDDASGITGIDVLVDVGTATLDAFALGLARARA